MFNRDGHLVIWAVAAGRHHNVVLCSGGPAYFEAQLLRGAHLPLLAALIEDEPSAAGAGIFDTLRGKSFPDPSGATWESTLRQEAAS